MSKHKHLWLYICRGHGLPPKQNVPDPEIFDGHVAECECGVKMFFPDDPKLKPQEIEQ